MTDNDSQYVVVGRVSGLHGVRGWCKVYSWTSPRENILKYSPWYLKQDGEWIAHKLAAGKRQGKGIIAQLMHCDDRDTAAGFVDAMIAVKREQLPPAEEGEFYWSDLIGLVVKTTNGIELGKVKQLMPTGSNDVMVIDGDRERLIPFVQGDVIKNINLDEGFIEVNWDPEF